MLTRVQHRTLRPHPDEEFYIPASPCLTVPCTPAPCLTVPCTPARHMVTSSYLAAFGKKAVDAFGQVC